MAWGGIAGSYQGWSSPGIQGEHFQRYLDSGWGIMTALRLWRGTSDQEGLERPAAALGRGGSPRAPGSDKGEKERPPLSLLSNPCVLWSLLSKRPTSAIFGTFTRQLEECPSIFPAFVSLPLPHPSLLRKLSLGPLLAPCWADHELLHVSGFCLAYKLWRPGTACILSFFCSQSFP